MRRFLFYLFTGIAFICRIVNVKWYMRILVTAHKSQGVVFDGMPEYIQRDAYLDPSGGLTISKGTVISTRVVILTHDWSFLKRSNYLKIREDGAFNPVFINENSFIGAGAIILPGSIIGKNCIIGAGAVVKGSVGDYSIVAGNPAKKIGVTNDK